MTLPGRSLIMPALLLFALHCSATRAALSPEVPAFIVAGQQAAASLAAAPDLRPRLGQIRDTASDGLWCRAGGERLHADEFGNGRYNASVFKPSAGFDRRTDTVLYGAAFTGLTGRLSAGGRAPGHVRGAAAHLYSAWTHQENGAYASAVLSAAHAGLTANGITEASGAQAFGLSLEAGQRLDLSFDLSWFAEPQAELSAVHVRRMHFSVTDGGTITLKRFSPLTARLGAVVGKQLFSELQGRKTGELYVRGGLSQQWNGTRSMTFGTSEARVPGNVTSFYAGLGADVIAADHLRFWGTVQAERGSDSTQRFTFCAGMKLQF